MEARHFIYAAIGLSVAGHLALVAAALLDDTRLFAPVQTVEVEIVTPDQIDRAPSEKPVPDAVAPDLAVATEPATASPPPSPPAAVPAAPEASPWLPQLPAATPQAAAPAPPTETPAAPSTPAAPEPDVTVKYGVMLGLPDGDGGTAATKTADLGPLAIAAFKTRLKSCATLPASVAPGDQVRVVLRVMLAPDGRLLAEPEVMEARNSRKAPALMRAAIDALKACQPYAMLPADKYAEWKMLDLAFTPQDFTGG